MRQVWKDIVEEEVQIIDGDESNKSAKKTKAGCKDIQQEYKSLQRGSGGGGGWYEEDFLQEIGLPGLDNNRGGSIQEQAVVVPR